MCRSAPGRPSAPPRRAPARRRRWRPPANLPRRARRPESRRSCAPPSCSPRAPLLQLAPRPFELVCLVDPRTHATGRFIPLYPQPARPSTSLCTHSCARGVVCLHVGRTAACADCGYRVRILTLSFVHNRGARTASTVERPMPWLLCPAWNVMLQGLQDKNRRKAGLGDRETVGESGDGRHWTKETPRLCVLPSELCILPHTSFPCLAPRTRHAPHPHRHSIIGKLLMVGEGGEGCGLRPATVLLAHPR